MFIYMYIVTNWSHAMRLHALDLSRRVMSHVHICDITRICCACYRYTRTHDLCIRIYICIYIYIHPYECEGTQMAQAPVRDINYIWTRLITHLDKSRACSPMTWLQFVTIYIIWTWLITHLDKSRECSSSSTVSGGEGSAIDWYSDSAAGTWLIHKCDMTHSRVRHDSWMCATWLSHVCDMTHACVRYDDRLV